MSSNDAGETRPRVLFVYYTLTQQAQRACEVMAEVMRTRGCDVSEAAIEFTDQAQAFANQLADTLAPAGRLGDSPSAPEGPG